ncbi:MAG: glutamine synthetase beta-grasp domain-containing protein [Bacteroidia bacterium]|nr:glutamine synthetase beta-grasp domain-containing protein [Bacteroidia bacterium]
MKTNIIKPITICLYFCNIAGDKNKLTVSDEQLKLAFSEGIRIDSSDILGLTEICDSEFILWPEPETIRCEKESDNSFLTSYNCKVTTPEGKNIAEISDELMKTALDKAKSFGLISINNESYSNFIFPKCNPTVLLNAI